MGGRVVGPVGVGLPRVDTLRRVADNRAVTFHGRDVSRVPASTRASISFDPAVARAEFPALMRPVRGRPLVYLDNAATTQKPRVVLRALRRHYVRANANVRRG